MSELLLKTPIFDVVKLPKVSEGFNPVGIKSKDWAQIIVELDNKFLIVNQLRYGINQVTKEFPCGTVEDGELAIDAIERELREETGYLVNKSNFVYLGRLATNPAFMNNHMYYYYVNLNECPYELTKTEFDEYENITHKWVGKDEFLIDIFKNNNNVSYHSLMVSGLFLLLSKDIKK